MCNHIYQPHKFALAHDETLEPCQPVGLLIPINHSINSETLIKLLLLSFHYK